MVVDWVPAHPYQAETLLFTLEQFAAVPRQCMIVQCTDRVAEDVRRAFRQDGHVVASFSPYLDRTYCNKIAQLDYFADANRSSSASTDYDIQGVFLLDLDVAVLSPLDIPDPEVVWGKIVDGANPGLAVIERLFAAAGIELPPVVPCDWEGRGETVATNFNGGFLYIPHVHLRRLRAAWRKWAEFLHARPSIFDHPSAKKHLDQVSFAMALASEEIPYRHLPTNWNFPCHEDRHPRSFRPEVALRALHYHDRLDEFGLIAPVVSGFAALNTAVERVNATLGRRRGTAFFDGYRRHRAKEAVRLVPVMPKAMFSPDFIARTWIGNRKRRLVLHAGTPKTGTSSLQHHLGANRQRLAANGYWYPPPSDTPEPKHQQINGLLRHGDERAFAAYVEAALRDMPDHTHTILFTTEGIFNHWQDYAPRAKGMLRQLAALFDFELCVWFRPPEYFAAALYAQYVRNPQTTDTPKNVYGRDIDFAGAMRDRWFRRHLDYLGFYHETRHLFGASRVKAFIFASDTVQTFVDEYGIRDLPAGRRWRNTTMHRPGIDIMRIANRFQLGREDHLRIEGLVREIDAVIGNRAKPFRLNEDERALVARYGQRGWELLQPALTTNGNAFAPRRRAVQKNKVFCIGFHKTGTKSLGQALRILGYRVTGPNGAREPGIGSQALSMALALATEFDAFNDNPWPLLYQELDATFPGSRFILTMREPSRWIASVVAYFGDEETPMREWVYGHGAPRGFEADYLARYSRHSEEVMLYFAGRDDLLVMDLENGDGWEKLCGFLEAFVPATAFPHENRREG